MKKFFVICGILIVLISSCSKNDSDIFQSNPPTIVDTANIVKGKWNWGWVKHYVVYGTATWNGSSGDTVSFLGSRLSSSLSGHISNGPYDVITESTWHRQAIVTDFEWPMPNTWGNLEWVIERISSSEMVLLVILLTHIVRCMRT